MSRSVLEYQFVAGLLPDLKRRVAGMEGNFDHLLSKAQFEEAQRRGLAENTSKPRRHLPALFGPPKVLVTEKPAVSTTGEHTRSNGGLKCFHCQGTGHFVRNCPLRGRAAPSESRGQSHGTESTKKIAVVAVNEEFQNEVE